MAKGRVLAVVGVKAKEGELVYYKDGKLMAVKAKRGGKKGRKVCSASKPKPTKKAAPKKAAKKPTKKAPVKKAAPKKTAKKRTTKRSTSSKQLSLFKR